MGKGPWPLLFKHQISLTIFHKQFGLKEVWALKTRTLTKNLYLKEKSWVGPGEEEGVRWKTILTPETNRDAMKSTWLIRSRELRETFTGGRLYSTNISPAGPRSSLNKTIHKERKGIKILFQSREMFYLIKIKIAKTVCRVAFKFHFQTCGYFPNFDLYFIIFNVFYNF